jgi:CBS domain-containing protein
MTIVKQILDEKGHEIWAVRPETTVLETLRLMDQKDIGAVLVVDEGVLVGIFSERDFARTVAQSAGANVQLPVKDLMTHAVYYVVPDRTLDECMALMTEKHIRHLPVLEDGNLVGMISIGDVVKSVITDRESIIKGLENYIVGREYSL